MEPESWGQVGELFKGALAREGVERASYLAEACGADEALRREVESLVAAHERAEGEGFLVEPAADFSAPFLAEDEGEGDDGGGGLLPAGQVLGHYRVLAPLGAGGMGQVYLAEDTTLRRAVALKILPADVAADDGRMRRFKQEACAASALNQPNILTVYEFGEADALQFIAAEHVDGLTLREYVADARPPLTELLGLAAQVAAALDAAHEAHVVHRDIKPENVMVRRRDRIVKVLDFGLAKVTGRGGSAELGSAASEAETQALARTAPGAVMGTVSYMSPEQARGERVDHRTDLWSLGVVLYELVAGRRPFGGATGSHVVVEILEKEPPPLQSYAGAALPEELQRIVSKALAKKPEERYQTAKDLLIDLRNLKRRLELDAESQRSRPADIPTPPPPGAAEQTGAPRDTHETSGRRRLVAGIVLALVVPAAAGIGLRWWDDSRNSPTAAAPPDAVTTPAAPPDAAGRELNYWLTVQKYRDGRPYQEPFRLASEINFEQDYRVRLHVRGAQPGHLYVLNEGPQSEGRPSRLLILFPSPTANEGSSRLGGGEEVQIPERSWFQFDAQRGTEKLWLVWSAEPVPELESLKVFANASARGVVGDPALNEAAEAFLRARGESRPSVEQDGERRETRLRAPGELLVHLLRLEHH